MNYLVLSIIVIVISWLYQRLKTTEKITKEVKWFFYIAICFSLCLFAGLRTRYNDTPTYIQGFLHTPKDISALFSSEFSISEVYLFQLWNYVIYHLLSKNAHVFLFLSSVVFVCPAVYLMEKYSKNFLLSIVLFMFGGMYLFSLAGLKQAMATGVMLMAFPCLTRKEYVKYYLACLVAIGFHTYSIFFLIIPLLGREVFNKRTVLFSLLVIFMGVAMSYFSGLISAVVKVLGEDVSEETIQMGAVNTIRAAVFTVPLILAFIGRKKLAESTDAEKILVKAGVLSSVFMILALFGNPILFGRIPQYFLIGIVVSLPLVIEKVFVQREHRAVLIIAGVLYVLYGIYALYSDGAFARDIFQLIWF